MLQIPEVGFHKSVKNNNIDPIELGDWLEASTLFFSENISKSDVVDVLGEQDICNDQDVANLIADEGWSELKSRYQSIGRPDTYSIDGNTLNAGIKWQDDPIRAFFLVLSLFRLFPKWADEKKDFTLQGLLFEKVVEVLCANVFAGWEVYRVGSSPENASNIVNVVETLAERLNCRGAADLENWVFEQGKDGGLDVVCYRFFDDNREALPVFLIQCASGNNWRKKIHTPNASEWSKLLNAAVSPGTGIAAPFVIDEKTLRIIASKGQVIVIDRLRLLEAYYKNRAIVTEELIDEVTTWLKPYIKILPQL